jgi:hypothetical protein
MLGAAILQQTYPAGFYAVNVPLRHDRQPTEQLDSECLWKSLISEILGVVLMRCILSNDTTILKKKLLERSLCLQNNIQMAWYYLQRIQQQLKTTTWWHSDEEIMQSLETLLSELETLLRLYREPSGLNQISLLKRLQNYVTNPQLIEHVELAKIKPAFQSKENKYD